MPTLSLRSPAKFIFGVAIPSAWQKLVSTSLDSYLLPYMVLFLSSDFTWFIHGKFIWWHGLYGSKALVMLVENRRKSGLPWGDQWKTYSSLIGPCSLLWRHLLFPSVQSFKYSSSLSTISSWTRDSFCCWPIMIVWRQTLRLSGCTDHRAISSLVLCYLPKSLPSGLGMVSAIP